jgi:energy-coupling factor transporter ATP-binding protein EcfA2
MLPLKSFEQFASNLYKRKLGLEVTLGSVSEHNPSWLLVDERDYLRTVSGSSRVGVLLDPEIGLGIFIVDYSGGDLQEEFTNALAVSSRMLTSKASDEIDEYGGWRTGICWLVCQRDEQAWRSSIAERRGRSGVTEEVLVDCVFYSLDDLNASLERNAAPWLLLEFRSLLRKSELEMAAWSSANDDVRRALNGLPDHFTKRGERAAAELILEEIGSAQPAGAQAKEDGTARALRHLRLRNFRNLKELDLNFESDGKHAVWPNVLFGPNGSGKSSIVEALSIAFTGCSQRMCEFEEDPDQEKNVSYVDEVLRTVDAKHGPEIILNESTISILRKGERASLRRADGNVLSQEASLQFVRMTGSDLAAQALRDYSQLADDVLEFIDQETRKANDRKDRLLRDLGERTSISKIDTILTRIARNAIGQEVPDEPIALARWLSLFCRIHHEQRDTALHLMERQAASFSGAGRQEFEKKLTQFMNPVDPEGLSAVASGWLKKWNDFAKQAGDMISTLRQGSWEEWVDRCCNDLGLWAKSLQSKSSFTEVGGTASALEAAKLRRDAIQRDVDQILAMGKEKKALIEYLESISSFVQVWVRSHSKDCPTCGATHEQPIDSIVQERLKIIRREHEALLAKYASARKDLETVQQLLVQAGVQGAVLSREREQVIRDVVRARYPGKLLEEALSTPTGTEDLLQLFSEIRSLPPIPRSIEGVQDSVERITKRVSDLTQEATEALEMPQCWSAVSSRVRQVSEEILLSKLPSTLRSAWRELVWALTPARWIMSAQPSLELSSQRKSRKLNVTADIRDKHVLAKYFFNISECHVLGISWFFMRYLTNGRFRNSCLVLDDPAQEMDQTTFSSLVRFLAFVSRIHKVRAIPLTMVVFMHQEERALEVARATDAAIHILSWTRSQGGEGSTPLRRLKLLQEGVGMAPVTQLFRGKAASTA